MFGMVARLLLCEDVLSDLSFITMQLLGHSVGLPLCC